LRRGGAVFDYVAKEGKRREIAITDRAVLSTLRVLAASDNGLDALFCWQNGDGWHRLHSHDVSAYIDPQLILRYQSDGELAAIPALAPVLPAGADAEAAVALLLSAGCG
jgi:hypothetical protein